MYVFACGPCCSMHCVIRDSFRNLHQDHFKVCIRLDSTRLVSIKLRMQRQNYVPCGNLACRSSALTAALQISSWLLSRMGNVRTSFMTCFCYHIIHGVLQYERCTKLSVHYIKIMPTDHMHHLTLASCNSGSSKQVN